MQKAINNLTALKNNLTQGLYDRSGGIFRNLNIILHHQMEPEQCPLAFEHDVFLMASALDPTYHWLQDIPSTFEEKQAVRHCIDGK